MVLGTASNLNRKKAPKAPLPSTTQLSALLLHGTCSQFQIARPGSYFPRGQVDWGLEQPLLNLLWARNLTFHRYTSTGAFLPEEGTASSLQGKTPRCEQLHFS